MVPCLWELPNCSTHPGQLEYLRVRLRAPLVFCFSWPDRAAAIAAPDTHAKDGGERSCSNEMLAQSLLMCGRPGRLIQNMEDLEGGRPFPQAVWGTAALFLEVRICGRLVSAVLPAWLLPRSSHTLSRTPLCTVEWLLNTFHLSMLDLNMPLIDGGI